MSDQMEKLPKVRAKPKSRPRQWADAAGRCASAISDLNEALSALEDAAGDLRSVQEDYETWKDSLPENLASSALGEKLEAVCDLAIEDIVDNVRAAIDEAEGIISEADGIDLPMGFGRD